MTTKNFDVRIKYQVFFILFALCGVIWLGGCGQASGPSTDITPAIQISPTIFEKNEVSKNVASPTSAIPTSVPPTATTVPPSPTPDITPCLPKESSPSDTSPLLLVDAVRQAEASGQLPTNGGSADFQLSFDHRILFIQWLYPPNHTDLLAYNLQNDTVDTIARLSGWWEASPASDCIILIGVPKGESLEDFFGTSMIDSQGQRYQFEVKDAQLQPYSELSRFAWSPNGMKILYNLEILGSQRESLYIVSADGSDTQPLFLNEDEEMFIMEKAAWSPKGDQVAVVARYIDQQEDKVKKGIFLFQNDTKERRLIVRKMSDSLYWDSTGEYIYFRAVGSSGLSECHQFELATEQVVEVERSLCSAFLR